MAEFGIDNSDVFFIDPGSYIGPVLLKDSGTVVAARLWSRFGPALGSIDDQSLAGATVATRLRDSGRVSARMAG